MTNAVETGRLPSLDGMAGLLDLARTTTHPEARRIYFAAVRASLGAMAPRLGALTIELEALERQVAAETPAHERSTT